MITTTPIYISPKGGSITCLRSTTGRIYRSCSFSRCVYSRNLYKAKSHLDSLEHVKKLNSSNAIPQTAQRKTTLKWNADGELSAIDMARVLSRLANTELTQCDLK